MTSRNGNGPCNSAPIFYANTLTSRTLSCAVKKAKNKLDGNHVVFEDPDTPGVDEGTLKIHAIKYDYCVPEQSKCQCSNLLHYLFVHYIDEITEIKAAFKSDECRCLLEAAVNAGYKYVQMTQPFNPRPECTQKHPLNGGPGGIGGWVESACNGYEINNCGSSPITITKH